MLPEGDGDRNQGGSNDDRKSDDDDEVVDDGYGEERVGRQG
jgi:hypothetical protein